MIVIWMLATAGALLLILPLTVVIRTVRYSSPIASPASAASAPSALPEGPDPARAVERLAQALRIRTISSFDSTPPHDALLALRGHLATAFPRTHAALSREVVDGYSLLYAWRGSDPTLAPLVLMSHQDVVPVEPGTEGQWTAPPFDGRIVDGALWGRGAIDAKGGLLADLEAVEFLLAEGLRPRRTVYLAFGHDEEVGGHGAAAIAELLRSRGIVPEAVLDEGGFVTRGVLAGVTRPVALIGITEKGHVSVALTAEVAGGHSAAPPRETAVGIVSAAVARLEAHPFPTRFTPVDRAMFDAIGPTMALGRRFVLANLWLFGPLLRRLLAATPNTNALVRTTMAPTMFDGSVAANQLPARARAVVNVRVLHGDSVAGVLARMREIVHDPRVQVAVHGPAQFEPSPVASTASVAYETLAAAIHATIPDAVVAPYLIVGGTDARHYRTVCPNVYGFLPVTVTPEELQGFHGLNERVTIASYGQAIQIMIDFVRGMAGGGGGGGGENGASATRMTTQVSASGATDAVGTDDLAAAAQRAVDEKTKPVGSLGELEAWAVRLASIQGTLTPRLDRARVVVFGADHGVAAEGVSAYPPQVTAEMMRNFGRGGAAINVLTRANGVEVEVIDVGVDADLAGVSGIIHAKVRRGSRNMYVEPAMTAGECDAALAVGRDAVRRAARDGVRAIGLGDMGIGNTTAAAALLSALTGAAPGHTVGRGTGVDDQRLAHKRAVVAAALARHQGAMADPRAAIEALGGLEIAAMCGAALEAPRHGMAIVADGFISSVAVLAACRIDPSIAGHVFVAHRSAEAGHAIAIDALGARPMLSLNLRLGEGTGAALAIPLLRAAAAMLSEMATFASAGVSRDA